jgi:hypothetical protein
MNCSGGTGMVCLCYMTPVDREVGSSEYGCRRCDLARFCRGHARLLPFGGPSSLSSFQSPQNFLNRSGDTGYFGVLTQTAVESWQSMHGISPVGIVGLLRAPRSPIAHQAPDAIDTVTIGSNRGRWRDETPATGVRGRRRTYRQWATINTVDRGYPTRVGVGQTLRILWAVAFFTLISPGYLLCCLSEIAFPK